ncbi:protein of unknown function DUF3444 [Macleaya cordata]|uniref:DUF3444 domain-containing protein n=1 Tax=Macleaya cordata TaxID=56857 RepID=A0A200R7V5_MACCD|nr:protein of unknown function DUF3444 [Macleaya cordata]
MNNRMVSFHIPSNELLRFSHRVPSFRTTGREREDIPEAEESPHLPKKRKNPDDKNTLDQGNLRTGNWCPRLSDWCHKKKRSASNRVEAHANETVSNALNSNTDIVAVHSPCAIPNADFYNFEQIPSSPFHLNPFEIPDAEFYDFEDDKSPEKFKPGQIWAVYCNLDDFPKYYVQIKRVKLTPDFKLCVKWLKSCVLPKDVIE